jgi:hypothetical protein
MIIEETDTALVDVLPVATTDFVSLVNSSSVVATVVVVNVVVSVLSVVLSVNGSTVLRSIGHRQLSIHPVTSDLIRTHGYSQIVIGH